MADFDTEKQHPTQLTPTPTDLNFEVDPSMEDHDMLLHHVVQHDHEMYAFDSSLNELLGV